MARVCDISSRQKWERSKNRCGRQGRAGRRRSCVRKFPASKQTKDSVESVRDGSCFATGCAAANADCGSESGELVPERQVLRRDGEPRAEPHEEAGEPALFVRCAGVLVFGDLAAPRVGEWRDVAGWA